MKIFFFLFFFLYIMNVVNLVSIFRCLCQKWKSYQMLRIKSINFDILLLKIGNPIHVIFFLVWHFTCLIVWLYVLEIAQRDSANRSSSSVPLFVSIQTTALPISVRVANVNSLLIGVLATRTRFSETGITTLMA